MKLMTNCLRVTLVALPLAWLACGGGDEALDVETDPTTLQGETEAEPSDIDKAQPVLATCCGFEAEVVCSTTGESFPWIQCNGTSLNQARALCNSRCDGDCVSKNASCDL